MPNMCPCPHAPLCPAATERLNSFNSTVSGRVYDRTLSQQALLGPRRPRPHKIWRKKFIKVCRTQSGFGFCAVEDFIRQRLLRLCGRAMLESAVSYRRCACVMVQLLCHVAPAWSCRASLVATQQALPSCVVLLPCPVVCRCLWLVTAAWARPPSSRHCLAHLGRGCRWAGWSRCRCAHTLAQQSCASTHTHMHACTPTRTPTRTPTHTAEHHGCTRSWWQAAPHVAQQLQRNSKAVLASLHLSCPVALARKQPALSGC
jgi:hypothetical protein